MEWLARTVVFNNLFELIIYGLILSIILFLSTIEEYRLLEVNIFSVIIFLCVLILLIRYTLKRPLSDLFDSNVTILETIKEDIKKEKYGIALEKLQNVKLYRNHINYKRYWLGVIHTLTNNFEEALRYFDSVEYDNPDSASFFYFKGLALSSIDEYEQSIKYFSKAIDLENVKNLEDRNNLSYEKRGIAYSKLNEIDLAENDFLTSIKINPYYSNLTNYGRILAEKGLNEKAIEYYNDALKYLDSDPTVYLNRAESNQQLGNYSEVIEDAEKVIKLDDKVSSSKAYFKKGIAQTKLHNLQHAILDYDKAEELGYNSPNLYFNRGSLKCALGILEEGLQDLIRALEMGFEDAKPVIDKYKNNIK